jgi:hypothetical protein
MLIKGLGGQSVSGVALSAPLRNLSRVQKIPITRKYQHIKPIIKGTSLSSSDNHSWGATPPCFDNQIISAIFKRPVITISSGKIVVQALLAISVFF